MQTGAHPADKPCLDMRVWLWLIVAALAGVALFLIKGNPAGHDFEFHISNWHEVAQQWRSGMLYPRWAAQANFGAGEPRFIFYPPFAPMLGAALSFVFPMQAAPAEFAFLALLLAGVGMFQLARPHLTAGYATAAACAYILNPYHLVTLYWDFRVAELLASAIFPFAMLAVLRLAGGEKRILPLALAVAAIWLTNGPAGVMLMYSVVLYLCTSALLRRELQSLVRGAAALAAGVGLAAFFLLPVIYEQKWVHLGGLFGHGLSVPENFLFSASADGPHTWFSFLVSEIAVEEMLLLSIAGAVVYFHRKVSADDERWRKLAPMVVLAMAASFMMFRISAPLWHLPKLEFMQFPWRWLLVLNVALCLLGAVALSHARMRWLWVVGLLAFFGYTERNVLRQASWGRRAVTELQLATAPIGYRGAKEYTPLSAPVPKLLFERQEAPPVRLECAEDCGKSSIGIERWWPDRRKFEVETQRPGRLTVHLYDYPAWDAKIDRVAIAITPDANGNVSVPISAGQHVARFKFTRTADRMWGGVVSIVTALLLLAGEVLYHRRRRPERPSP